MLKLERVPCLFLMPFQVDDIALDLQGHRLCGTIRAVTVRDRTEYGSRLVTQLCDGIGACRCRLPQERPVPALHGLGERVIGEPRNVDAQQRRNVAELRTSRQLNQPPAELEHLQIADVSQMLAVAWEHVENRPGRRCGRYAARCPVASIVRFTGRAARTIDPSRRNRHVIGPSPCTRTMGQGNDRCCDHERCPDMSHRTSTRPQRNLRLVRNQRQLRKFPDTIVFLEFGPKRRRVVEHRRFDVSMLKGHDHGRLPLHGVCIHGVEDRVALDMPGPALVAVKIGEMGSFAGRGEILP